jgi:hypothetical protein
MQFITGRKWVNIDTRRVSEKPRSMFGHAFKGVERSDLAVAHT